MNKQKRKKMNKSNPMARIIKNSQKFNNTKSKKSMMNTESIAKTLAGLFKFK